MNILVLAHVPTNQINKPSSEVSVMAIGPSDEAHFERCLGAIGRANRDKTQRELINL